MTAASREAPTPAEVAPWVETIIRLWDDADWYGRLSRRATEKARRWSPEELEPEYTRFFEHLGRRDR